jgi:hypothetical protein
MPTVHYAVCFVLRVSREFRINVKRPCQAIVHRGAPDVDNAVPQAVAAQIEIEIKV